MTHARWPRLIISISLTLCVGGWSSLGGAACGCEKPPPEPAAVIPPLGYPGLDITLFDAHFHVGEDWEVVFENPTHTQIVMATVIMRRHPIDPTGETLAPQLPVRIPAIAMGPTTIRANREGREILIPASAFTVVGHPLMLSAHDMQARIKKYETAVDTHHTVYVTLAGVDDICEAVILSAQFRGFPLRIDGMIIVNRQGSLIEVLTPDGDVFRTETKKQHKRSDAITYVRHAFTHYCQDHHVGGEKEMDLTDPNWHLDGTPHIDYHTLFVGLTGVLPDGSRPAPGPVVFDIRAAIQLLER